MKKSFDFIKKNEYELLTFFLLFLRLLINIKNAYYTPIVIGFSVINFILISYIVGKVAKSADEKHKTVVGLFVALLIICYLMFFDSRFYNVTSFNFAFLGFLFLVITILIVFFNQTYSIIPLCLLALAVDPIFAVLYMPAIMLITILIHKKEKTTKKALTKDKGKAKSFNTTKTGRQVTIAVGILSIVLFACIVYLAVQSKSPLMFMEEYQQELISSIARLAPLMLIPLFLWIRLLLHKDSFIKKEIILLLLLPPITILSFYLLYTGTFTIFYFVFISVLTQYAVLLSLAYKKHIALLQVFTDTRRIWINLIFATLLFFYVFYNYLEDIIINTYILS